MLKRWKTLKSKKVFECPWYNINEDDFELPNKKTGKYFVIKMSPSVMVVPITSDRKIIFVKQYRYPVDGFYLELPAGNTDGKNILNTASNELEEEAGYKAKKIKRIGQFAPLNGGSSEICYLFLATDLIKAKQKLEPTEFIEVEEIPIKKAYKMIEEGEIKCGITIAALSLARKHLEKYLK